MDAISFGISQFRPWGLAYSTVDHSEDVPPSEMGLALSESSPRTWIRRGR